MKILWLIILLAGAAALIYFFNWPILAVSRLQYQADRYFRLGLMAEGDRLWQRLLDFPSPYINASRKTAAVSWLELLGTDLIADSEKQDLAKRALAELQALTIEESGNYAYWAALADAATITAGYDESFLAMAAEAVAKARQLSPRRQTPLYILFRIRQLQGDRLGAIRALEEAINLDQIVGDPYFLYAVTLIENGFVKEGKEALATAKKLGREARDFKEHRALAIVLAQAGEKELAQLYLEKALGFRPGDSQLQQLKKELMGE